jgi:hypothetical protein
MTGQLALATLMVGLTVTIHFGGLVALQWMLRARAHALHGHESPIRQGMAIMLTVMGLVLIHSAEVWSYAGAFLAVGALDDFETALYFSTASFTTIGYGDVVLAHRWRLMGAIEGANGLLMFGWSTAFLISITSRVRVLEYDWLERARGA